MAVVYVLMYFKCKICFTVYTGETKINDTYTYLYYFPKIYAERGTYVLQPIIVTYSIQLVNYTV